MFKVLILLLFPAYLLAQEAPFKPADEYEVTPEYKFQERPPIDRANVAYQANTDESNRKVLSGPLPYLKINVKLLKVNSGEAKLRVVDSDGKVIFNRKAAEGTKLTIDAGFIDDVKDRVSPYSYTISLFTDSKKVISRIHMIIMEDGTFLVNDEKRGKF